MRRRSRAGGESAKSQRRKTAARKPRNAPAIAVRRGSTTDQETEFARIIRERDQALEQLSEALERQTATSEVLKVISSSPGELGPVFDTVLENATRLCEANFGILYRFEDDAFRAIALRGAPLCLRNFSRAAPSVQLRSVVLAVSLALVARFTLSMQWPSSTTSMAIPIS